MDKKKTGKTRKSRAATSVRNLRVKTLDARSAKGAKGGATSELTITRVVDKSSPVLYQSEPSLKR